MNRDSFHRRSLLHIKALRLYMCRLRLITVSVVIAVTDFFTGIKHDVTVWLHVYDRLRASLNVVPNSKLAHLLGQPSSALEIFEFHSNVPP